MFLLLLFSFLFSILFLFLFLFLLGIVYCGTVGNELRREYAAVGEVVNLAARLMSKANGEILLDEKTYSRLPEAIHRKLNKRPLMMVKGKDKPIVTYQFDATITVQEDGRLGECISRYLFIYLFIYVFVYLHLCMIILCCII